MKQDLETITFNDLPQAVAMLIKEVREFKELVKEININIANSNINNISNINNLKEQESERWMNLHELHDYLPDKPNISTIYGWTSQRLIPHYKKGNRLYFLKSEIDEWLKSGRIKTNAEIEAEAEKYISRNRINKYRR